MLEMLKFCLAVFALHGTCISFSQSKSVDPGRKNDVSDNQYWGAIVKFNYTDKEDGDVILGSMFDTDEIGWYGHHSPLDEITGQIVLAVDDDDHHFGCTSHSQNYSLSQLSRDVWIALAARGECNFAEKITNAAAQGAGGIIIYDSEDGDGEPVFMSHKAATGIVAVLIKNRVGVQVTRLAEQGINLAVDIRKGSKHPEYEHDNKYLLHTASIVFVSVSFMILMLVSLAWLVFYYIQRFRLLQASTVVHRRRNRTAVRKAVDMLTTRTLQRNDQLLITEGACAVCIDNFHVGDVVRQLDCNHCFHKKCVDPWLMAKQTCPMCKGNISKSSSCDGGHEMAAIGGSDRTPPAHTATLSQATESNVAAPDLQSMPSSSRADQLTLVLIAPKLNDVTNIV